MHKEKKLSLNVAKKKLKKAATCSLPVKRALKKNILNDYDIIYKCYRILGTDLFAHEKAMIDLNIKYGKNAVIRSFRKQLRNRY